MTVFVEHAPDVWNMCQGCEVNSSQVVCANSPQALQGPQCVLLFLNKVAFTFWIFLG